ncbi:hypothetical protein NEUTE1DRAFT_133733 [Neurospora tetrasperma FGSC 2508]|uniref:Uncharacterized protein n=1 Tax=Neurospora tetrasperma (strain FGSC 2508 / ATCC MYA-4615 / P0657) TaxID=510951 RepID=F8N2D4_NEUT8|nr:uncharacterized protein NEUTE1DRAFT_133733 [Neurospora tetrasperma FGSC 2508]EGO53305.1 hypothetical protein NEUTE1DRAFT_133733 [Neurospora tetrasperma FGSC 2508]
MMLTPIPRTYPDPDLGYEATHKPPTSATPHYPINPVLSPGTTHRVRWTTAIQAFISVLGQDAVLIDSALSRLHRPVRPSRGRVSNGQAQSPQRNRLPWLHGLAERHTEDCQQVHHPTMAFLTGQELEIWRTGAESEGFRGAGFA